jgi:drug/metabolite transporter (DMT)-like permease
MKHYAVRMLKHPTESITLDVDSRRTFAILLMVLGSIAISFGGLIQRNIEIANPWQINVYRSMGTLLTIAVILAFQNRRQFFTGFRAVGKLGIVAGGLLAVAGMCFIQALTHTTIANALFILGSIPFFTALLARIVLGERLRKATLVTMIFAGAGLVVMVAEGITTGSGFGNIMALITALGFASYAIIIRYKRRIEMLPVLVISSAIIVIVSLLVTGDDLDIPLNDILLSVFWGACLSGFVNWTFIVASRHLAAAEVTLIMLLEFALGPIWVWWFINEVPSYWTITGGAIIIFAVAVRAILEMVNQSRPEQTPIQPV